jgi:hypothetical protein
MGWQLLSRNQVYPAEITAVTVLATSRCNVKKTVGEFAQTSLGIKQDGSQSRSPRGCDIIFGVITDHENLVGRDTESFDGGGEKLRRGFAPTNLRTDEHSQVARQAGDSRQNGMQASVKIGSDTDGQAARLEPAEHPARVVRRPPRCRLREVVP